jgi:hypothetical protein
MTPFDEIFSVTTGGALPVQFQAWISKVSFFPLQKTGRRASLEHHRINQ